MSDDFFDYAELNRLALFPCAAGTKRPIVKWKTESSFDRADWERWRSEGNNLAINCAASGLIVIDVDSSKVSPQEAWGKYLDLCTSWDLPNVPMPMTHSARGGWHIPFKRPADKPPEELNGGKTIVRISAVRPLAEGEKDGEIIGFKNRGYALAPESRFEGKDYSLAADPPAPHKCPDGLLEIAALPMIDTSGMQGADGGYDYSDTSGLVAALDALGAFDTEPDWFKYMGAIKLALGDTENGILVAEQMTWATASDKEFWSKWRRLSSTYQPGNCTIRSLIHQYKKMTGKHYNIRKSAEALFKDLTTVLPPPPDATPLPPNLPPNATPLIGGGPRTPQIVAPEYSEIEIADRFANDYAANIRYVTSRKSWLYWTGKRWHVDETDRVPNFAREHCRQEAALCASTPGQSNARTLCSQRTVQATLKLASMDQRVAVRADAWDQDPWLLGTPDGVVDLRTGTLRTARPEDHVTKSTAVAPNGDCPRWLAFLNSVTNGDTTLIRYLQKLAGYACTGSTREQQFFFLHGPGETGKGTFTHAIQSIMGDYQRSVNVRTLTESKQDRHLSEVAVLQGARLVTCSETGHGHSWAETRLKEWTGEDVLTANFMGCNPFDFLPTFKLFISGNHKPAMRPDSAMRRRLRLIPFVHVVPESEKDRSLGDKLREEWPGILGWMIAGALAWQQEGLDPPQCVIDATRDYVEQEADDALALWLDDKCDVTDPNAETVHSELYRSYRRFAEDAGERDIMSSVKLAKALINLGYRGHRAGKGKRMRKGIKLKPLEMPDEQGQPGNPQHFPGGVNLPPVGNHMTM